MEIPNKKFGHPGMFENDEDCEGCPFFKEDHVEAWGDLEAEWSCALFEETEDHKRCPACLSAYPNGAVITITAKEKR